MSAANLYSNTTIWEDSLLASDMSKALTVTQTFSKSVFLQHFTAVLKYMLWLYFYLFC